MLGEFELRPHQLRAIEETRTAIARLKAEGKPMRVVIVSACGSGKTVMSAAIMASAVEKGKRSVFLAHGRQLIYQKSRTLERAGLHHGMLMAGEEERFNNAPITVASKDTYWARAFESDRVRRFDHDVFIVDEAHASLGPSWDALLPKDKVVIGLTATPALPNGKGLGSFYQALVKPVSYADLIGLGLIVPARVFAPWSVDTRGLKKQDGDWSWDKVAGRFQEGTLTGDIVHTWIEHGEDRPTAVFASNVAHSVALCEEFNRAGIPAVHIDADTPQEERDDAFAAVRDGRVRVLCNFGVLTVGFDLPDLSCAVLAFSTASLVKYLQVVGRVLRPSPGKAEALVIDHGDNVRRHGWPTADHEWELNPEQTVEEREATIAEREKKAREPICCSHCGAMRETGPTCPNCGHSKQRRGQLVRTAEGKLIEIKPKDVDKRQAVDDDQRRWHKCLAMAANRGQNFYAARAMYTRFSSGRQVPPTVGPQPDRAQWYMKVGSVYPGYIRRRQG